MNPSASAPNTSGALQPLSGTTRRLAIWLFLLVPIQIRQARLARGFADGGPIPEDYRRLGRLWIAWGLVATVPLVAATWIMLRKGW